MDKNKISKKLFLFYYLFTRRIYTHLETTCMWGSRQTHNLASDIVIASDLKKVQTMNKIYNHYNKLYH